MKLVICYRCAPLLSCFVMSTTLKLCNTNKSKYIIFFFKIGLQTGFFLLTKADVVYKETKEIHSSFLFFYGIFAWEILLGFLAMNSKALFLYFFYLKYSQLPGRLFSLVIVFGFKLDCYKLFVASFIDLNFCP